MKIILNIRVVLDLEDVIRRLTFNASQRISECLALEFWIEKKR